jgi:cell division protein ZapA (FtsZ GTPase activity inhibitor)
MHSNPSQQKRSCPVRADEEDGMATQQQPIEVKIFGQIFRLISEKSEEDMRQIAAYVDHRMQQLADRTQTAVLLRVAIMAALTIADEYHTTTGQLDTGNSL